ncbi:MAG: DUF742 domain-containing protein [Actinomycetia bacterium]|nr:DUF742 domain-containing protein [Actinomycetes bacterium]MCP4087223.1 DUF742 domain-containing protein [Actinomycetes bacterium]
MTPDSPFIKRRIRPYALTGGRTRGEVDLPIEAQITATRKGTAFIEQLTAENRAIVGLATQPLSIAEISAHLDVALGVARVLVGDLVAAGLVYSTTAEVVDDRPDLNLLERVLDGLQAL